MTSAVGAPSPWEWHAHPDAWILVGALGVAYVVAIGRCGGATRVERASFFSGLAVLWVAADWPVHDIAEKYLFSVHMVQHLLLTLVAPPLLLYGIPPAVLRRLLRGGWPRAAVRWLARPLVAGLIFNAVTVFTHWPVVVDAALRQEALHFAVHALMVTTALLMWFPVLNRLPELPQLSYPGRMVYLFLQSIIPTVPASFLTFADGVIYKFYETVPRPWDVTAVQDQQVAGGLMKIVGAGILWSVIVVMFFRWYARTEGRRDDDVLTWADVERELERTPPAPSEH